MKKQLLVAAFVTVTAFSCVNQTEQKEKAPPHNAKEFGLVKKRVENVSSRKAAKKEGFYKDFYKKHGSFQDRKKKR